MSDRTQGARLIWNRAGGRIRADSIRENESQQLMRSIMDLQNLLEANPQLLRGHTHRVSGMAWPQRKLKSSHQGFAYGMEAGEEGETRVSAGEGHRRVRAVGIGSYLRDSILQDEPRPLSAQRAMDALRRAMAIDSPADKIREIIGEQDDELLDALVQVGAVFQPVVAIASAVKSVLDSGARHHCVCSAIRALCTEMERLEGKIPKDAAEALNSNWFRRAVQVMMEEAARSVDDERATQLGIAVAHGCFPAGDNAHRQEDLAFAASMT